MEPTIIKKDALVIRGLTGDGADTAGLWGRFERAYDSQPFAQADTSGYEIRVYGKGGCDCHVGVAVAGGEAREPFCDFALPKTYYASFDIIVANGYDSENARMNAWLASNPDGWVQSEEPDGGSIAVECYNSRFKSEGIVEIWIPVHK